MSLAPDAILAIDQGTTSSRAVAFDRQLQALAQAQQAIACNFPHPGWVEQDPRALWQSVWACIEQVRQSQKPFHIRALGITNQRETTLLWDKRTGEPLAPAIVWQDKRTSDFCDQLAQDNHAQLLRDKTGLPIDPYFSASKIRWLLDHTQGTQALAKAGQLAFGTVDSWLLWKLTGGEVHATDATNASRTQLFNLHSLQWDEELLALFDIPRSLLPEVKDSAGLFGHTAPHLFGQSIPIYGIAGDQQAATIGQRCVKQGQAKCTFGTGAFLMLNSGRQLVQSKQLISTLAYQLDGRAHYALEGSVFVAGSAIGWLRDSLKLFERADETAMLAQQMRTGSEVMMVPAFTGMGAPHWRAGARASLLGLSLDTGPAEIVGACLQSVALQVNDLLQAMAAEGLGLAQLNIDGGMSANAWFAQALADITQTPLYRPTWRESTVLGAALLAAHGLGWLDIGQLPPAMEGDYFKPAPADEQLRALLQRWRKAIAATLQYSG